MGLSEYWGQERIKRYFRKAKKTNTFHHSYILEGPKGIGKKTLVRFLAKLINCRESVDDFCGRCSSCRKLEKNIYSDFIYLSPLEDKKNISINQVKEIQNVLHYPPVEKGKRIIVIDTVESLSIEGQNSLLKTLEEPPPDNIFFLLTENRFMFLETILSRSELLTLKPLSDDVMRKAIKEKYPDIDEKTLNFLVENSKGILGFAFKIHADREIKEIYRLLENIFNGHAEHIFMLSSKFIKKGKKTDDLFMFTLRLLKNYLIKFKSKKLFLELYKKVERIELDFKEVNINPALALESVLLSIMETV